MLVFWVVYWFRLIVLLVGACSRGFYCGMYGMFVIVSLLRWFVEFCVGLMFVF